MKQGQDAERERRYEEMGILGKRYKRKRILPELQQKGRASKRKRKPEREHKARCVSDLSVHCLGHVRPPEWFRMIELPLGLFYTD